MQIHYNDFWLKYMNKSYNCFAIRRGKEGRWWLRKLATPVKRHITELRGKQSLRYRPCPEYFVFDTWWKPHGGKINARILL